MVGADARRRGNCCSSHATSRPREAKGDVTGPPASDVFRKAEIGFARTLLLGDQECL